MAAALAAAATAPRGPCFVDIPADQFFDRAPAGARWSADRRAAIGRSARSRRPGPGGEAPRRRRAAGDHGRRRRLLGGRRGGPRGAGRGGRRARPHERARAGARCRRRISLAFSRARSVALRKADLVVAAGVPLDFRLGLRAVRRRGPGGAPRRAPVAGGHPRGAGRARPPATSRPCSAGSSPPGWRRRRPTARAEWVARPLGRRDRPPGEGGGDAPQRPPTRSTRPASTASCGTGSSLTPWWWSTAATSAPTPASSSTPRPPARSSTPGPTAASGPGPGYGLAARLAAQAAGPARPPGVPHAGGRGGRVLADGLRHARPPRRAGGGHRRQQRHLGPGEAPDAGALRLRRGGRAAAGDPVRPGGGRRSAGTASW